MLTPEQLAMRRESYGASEVATVVGLGQGSLIELWESKVLPPKPEESSDDTLARDLGTLLEEPVAQVYAERTKTFLLPVGTLRHPTKPLALATPDRARFLTVEARNRACESPGYCRADRIQEAERLVEVKTTAGRYRREYGASGTGVVPEEKALQATWQMAVTGVRRVDLPVLFLGDFAKSFEVFTIDWNEQLFEVVYGAVERFHRDYVLTGKPPPPDATERYDEVLARMWPKHRLPAVTATPDQEALMARYAALRELSKLADNEKQRVRQLLVSAVGEAEGLISPVGKLTYKATRESQVVDWEAAAKRAMELAGLVLNSAPPNEPWVHELAQELAKVVPDATQVRAGHRSLRVTTGRGEELHAKAKQLVEGLK